MKTVTLAMDSKKPYPIAQKVNLIEACKRESPITNSMEYFLATGNLVSKHGLGILQVSAYMFFKYFYLDCISKIKMI